MNRRPGFAAGRRADNIALWAVVGTVALLTVLAVLMIVDLKFGGV